MRVLQYTSPEFADSCVRGYVKNAREAHHAFIDLKRNGFLTMAAQKRGQVIMAITCARFWSLYVKGILK